MRKTHLGGAEPHAAATYFAQQLGALIKDNHQVRMLNTGRTRTTKPLTVYKLIRDHCPEFKTSTTQWYRYFHGERAPRVDEIYCVAQVFGVSPRYFLPDTTA
ncbi:hypothetical protein EV589_5899 [Mycobacterium sp. BK558]|jgi:hypothetical protein|nr:hypothetical protein EV589_5899 [Mycobacterium sp. BK558]